MLLADEITRFARGPRRDAALGYLAVLQGRCTEAENRLRIGWERADRATGPRLASQVALRWTLHEVGRLRGAEIVEWGRRAIDLLPGDDAVRLETDALLGLGLGLAGRVPDGRAAYTDVLDRLTGDEGPTAGRVHMAHSWLRIIDDDLDGVPQILAGVVPDQLRQGSVRIAVWSSVWMARAHYLRGAWEEAAAAADQAVTLLDQTGHEWLRPLARWAATAVAAGRGDWTAAAGHVAQAHTGSGDYELMIVSGALAGAELAWARGEHEAVLTRLGPIVALRQREGVDEPGFWPWQHLCGDALVSAGRLDEADAFLAPHERLAQDRGRRSAAARLARVRGRLEAAAGRPGAADAAFREGLGRLDGLPLPFERPSSSWPTAGCCAVEADAAPRTICWRPHARRSPRSAPSPSSNSAPWNWTAPVSPRPNAPTPTRPGSPRRNRPSPPALPLACPTATSPARCRSARRRWATTSETSTRRRAFPRPTRPPAAGRVIPAVHRAQRRAGGCPPVPA